MLAHRQGASGCLQRLTGLWSWSPSFLCITKYRVIAMSDLFVFCFTNLALDKSLSQLAKRRVAIICFNTLPSALSGKYFSGRILRCQPFKQLLERMVCWFFPAARITKVSGKHTYLSIAVGICYAGIGRDPANHAFL